MRKGLIFQIFISLVLLVGWNLLHFGFEDQQNKIFGEASQAKMIIFSEDLRKLHDLEIELEQVYYIDDMEIESDTHVANMLIDNYDLGDVKDILVSYNLPNLMTISFAGEHYQTTEKLEFADFLIENYPELNTTFDEELWQNTQDNMAGLKHNYMIANLIYLGLLLFIMIFLRIHFEIKHDEFWRIFRSAGGSYHKRNIEFIKDSLILAIIPIGLIASAYYLLIYREIISYHLDLRLFGIELAALILVTLISRISLWSKF